MNLVEGFDRILAAQGPMIEAHLRLNIENMHRVGRLVGAFDRSGIEDVLRSAVVFLHATQEDCLRSIAAVLLPHAGEGVLNRVPMIGTPGSRPEKFFLGRLSDHRERTVAEVIDASVAEYLRHTTFNNATEIAELLRALNFHVQSLEGLFPAMEALMLRRHQIVHRADRAEDGSLTPITREQVLDWSNVIIQFISRIVAQNHNIKVFIELKQMLEDLLQKKTF